MSKRRKKNHKKPSGPPVLANVRLTVEPERLEIVYSRKRWEGLFVLAFSCIWTRGVYSVIGGLIRQGYEWKSGEIFGLGLFTLITLTLFFLVVCCFFHRERLRLDSNGLDWWVTAIFPIRHRKIPWDELVAFQRGYWNGGFFGTGVFIVQRFVVGVAKWKRRLKYFIFSLI